MQTRQYLPPSEPHEFRKFADGTWRQPAVYLRDMRRFRTSADRLRALRAKYPAPSGSPEGWTYDRGGALGDPAYWFGAESPANVARDEHGGVFYNYGEGLGTDIAPSRPFRFIGYADEVSGARIDHAGWYGDDEGWSVFRGTVYQLPARNGKPRYLAGYEYGERTRKGFSAGFGSIDVGGQGCVYDSVEEAAHAADSLAESAAECEREYQREEAECIEHYC